MQSLNDFIDNILHENNEFSKEFMDKMARMENEEFIDVEDLDDLFR